jgi:hypothetical protein
MSIGKMLAKIKQTVKKNISYEKEVFLYFKCLNL